MYSTIPIITTELMVQQKCRQRNFGCCMIKVRVDVTILEKERKSKYKLK
ncbi:MAG: hypothetical protein IPO37_17470 [Saprospiraceae bacterium]|nr:hypothetical protein [Saprospiraceae bacterium]